MRLLALASCLFVFQLALPQDWTSRGKIDSRTTQIPRRENGQVVGTEFIHYEYHVSTSIVPTDETYWSWEDWHQNICRGKKHPDHSKCDTSCDDVDKETVRETLRGAAWPLTSEMRKMESDSAKMAKGLGMPGGPSNWSSAASQYISQTMDAVNKLEVETVAAPHDLPCTYRYQLFGYKLSKIRVRGEFWKKGFYRSRGVDTPINAMVGSHEGEVAELWYPQAEPLEQSDYEMCRCIAPPAEDKPAPVTALSTGTDVVPVPGPGGCEFEDKDKRPVCPFEEQIEFDCIGQSLSEAFLRIENKCDADLVCTIPAGCELVPDNNGTQIMTCTEPTTVELPAKSAVYVWLPTKDEWSFLPLTAEAKLKVACTQIAKSMPTSSTKFKLRATKDHRLARVIDQPSGSSFFANTVTQARVWIYKDGSTREQINKVMIPGVTEGMYLNALYGIARSGIDLNSPKYRKCLDPKLLNSPTASKDSTLWFYWKLESMDPKSAEKLRGQALSECRRILAGAPERIDVRHVAHLALAMSDSENKDTRTAGLSVLEMTVPDALKLDFVNDGGLDVLRSAMTFGDDAEALKAIAIAKGYPNPPVKALLSGMAEWGRETIRTAAEEAAKGM